MTTLTARRSSRPRTPVETHPPLTTDVVVTGRLARRGQSLRAAHRPHRVVHARRHRRGDQPRLAQPRHHPVPGGDGLPAAALPRAHHPLARPGRRGALRRLLPLLRRLPGGLHRPAGDHGRERPPLPGVVPHQLLALHLLRLLRGRVPHLRHPAHAGRGDERVRAAQHGVREGGPADRRPRQVPRARLLPGGRPRHRRQGQGRGRERGAAGDVRDLCREGGRRT